ncbi:ABC transporter ATP-binding protein [Ruegeria sediminis]|uniref:ABC transporter ATP-binding protein n=1 Tax=Ruegeria sediminis TaxID=2583820 RepID=A0ABY2WT61_9RHOB|nr:ABC transporter ATP-binding protein [Ruegeria sediminis]TMV04257.1 ABC transporter ATP-binding protein [Ruegeria sediminis]
MLEVAALSVSHGRIRALQDVSLTISPGEVLAVAGMNGAGKSSLVNAICGLAQARSGRVTFDGRDITGQPLHRMDGIALMPEGRILAPSLTVAETLRLGAGRVNRREHDQCRAKVLARFPELGSRLGQRAGTLSGGEATMLALGRALMASPRLLLLDEPTLGLSPSAAERVFHVLEELRNDGLTLLLVEQNIHMALGFADRYLLLRHGLAVGAGRTPTREQAERFEEVLLGNNSTGENPC